MRLCNKTKIVFSVYLKHWVPQINQSSELFHKDRYGQIDLRVHVAALILCLVVLVKRDQKKKKKGLHK